MFGAAGDAWHHRPGGLVGVAFGVVLALAGLVCVSWALRAADRVGTDELETLRARGVDDGLPRGTFREDQRVGLEASDGLLVLAAVMAIVGVIFAVGGGIDPQVGWGVGLTVSLIGFVPAALCVRGGIGTKYWLTPEGVARRGRLQPDVKYADVERVVPLYRGSPVDSAAGAHALELQVPTSVRPGGSGRDFTIKLGLLEVGGPDLLTLLEERIRAARTIR
jgi:hypothetical protein